VPEASRLKGGIIGDVQAMDSDGTRHAFYVMTVGDKAVPQWIANLAVAAHSMHGIRVHIVVEQSSAILERSCRAAGAGLLELVTEGDYQLRTIVDGKEYSPEARSADVATKVKALRRRIETKMDANVKALTDKYGKVGEYTRGMPQPRQEEYAEAIEGEIRRWREWGERLTALLDEATATLDENILLTVTKEIEQGASATA
jgi:hypothetical protein